MKLAPLVYFARRLGLAAGLLVLGSIAVQAQTTPQPAGAAVEARLLQAADAIRQGQLAQAQEILAALTAQQPDFKLAQWLYAQVLAARSGVHGALPHSAAMDAQISDLVDEFRFRVQDTSLKAPPPGSVPDAVLGLSGEHRSAILVDLTAARLYIVEKEGGGLHVAGSYYAAIARNGFGKISSGDLRTPVGVYHATRFTPGAELPPLYGSGAFPLDYPNLWDRLLKRTGSGIWLHGVPANTYVRPPRTSEGCVVLANEDLLALRAYISASTPVIFSDGLRWQSPEAIATQTAELSRSIENWRARWSARDAEAYLSNYAPDFVSGNMKLAAFGEYKRGVFAANRNIDVRVRNLDLFRYPGERDLVLAEFTQDYRADRRIELSRKQQFWRRGADGRWRIEREDNRELPQTIAQN